MFKYGKAVCYQGYRKNHSIMKNVYPSKLEILEDLLILDKEFDYIRVYDTSLHTHDILEVISENKINIKVMLSMYLFVEENHINHQIFNEIDSDILEKNIMKNNNLCKDVIERQNNITMTVAANTSASINPKTSYGAIPTNVLVKLLAKATAGLAKNVEEVNQYPAVTVRATSIGTFSFAS